MYKEIILLDKNYKTYVFRVNDSGIDYHLYILLIFYAPREKLHCEKCFYAILISKYIETENVENFRRQMIS